MSAQRRPTVLIYEWTFSFHFSFKRHSLSRCTCMYLICIVQHFEPKSRRFIIFLYYHYYHYMTWTLMPLLPTYYHVVIYSLASVDNEARYLNSCVQKKKKKWHYMYRPMCCYTNRLTLQQKSGHSVHVLTAVYTVIFKHTRSPHTVCSPAHGHTKIQQQVTTTK